MFESKLFIRPSICSNVFSGLAHYFFLTFCIKLRFSKHKSDGAILEENFCYAQDWVNESFLDPESSLELFSESIHHNFLKFYLLAGLENW